MRRWEVFRILALVLFASLWFWLGMKQSCNHVSSLAKENALEDEEDADEDLLRSQTAKFNRNARMYALNKKCCDKKKLSLRSLPIEKAANLFRHIIVDKKNNFLYCFVPKVASSNMKRLILTLQGRSDNSDAIKYFDHRGFEFLGDFSVPERERLVKTLFKFMFVRDPLGRLVSAYRDKFQTTNNQFHMKYGMEIVQRYRKNTTSSHPANGDDVTFREFARYIIDEAAHKMNEHWMPIYEICQPCVIPYDFVGSFEDLDLDMKTLLHKLNVSRSVSFPKRQMFYHTPLDKTSEHAFYRNLTTYERKSLHTKYMKDFKCFNYGFPNRLQKS